MNKLLSYFLLGAIVFVFSGWGFYAHKEINRLAVFTLPPDMIGFYKKNIQYISEAAINPDRRRYAVVDEAPRHYIDVDQYGDSAVYLLPRTWNKAVEKHHEDTLKAHGILPWHLMTMYYRLRDAFLLGDPDKILSTSADFGHYIADAHVPLHTTKNYNGQLTGQDGIHGFWESRLPELYSMNYDFFVGKAEYLSNPQQTIWEIIAVSNSLVDSVLSIEKSLSLKYGEKKYSFETKGKQTVKVYSQEYSKAYHQALQGMTERQMRASIKVAGSFWYTAWVDSGQPDLKKLLTYKPSDEELVKRAEEVKMWKESQVKNIRSHEREE